MLATSGSRENGDARARRDSAGRSLDLDVPDPVWDAFVSAVARTEDSDRVVLEIDPAGVLRSSLAQRIGSVVERGYSIEEAEPEQLVLVPRPPRILWLSGPGFSGLGGGRSEALGVSGRFDHYIVALGAPPFELVGSVTQEVWNLAEFVGRRAMPQFLLEYLASRRIDIVQIVGSRLATDLLPTMRFSYPGVRLVLDLASGDPASDSFVTYASARYGNLVDAFCVPDGATKEALRACSVPDSKVVVLGPDGPLGAAEQRAALYGRLLAEAVGLL